MTLKAGRGLDIGTGLLASAGIDVDGNTITKSVRHSFLELIPPNKLVAGTMKKGLIKSGVNFFETDGRFFVLGEDSLIQAIERQLITKRPMAKGVISPKEAKALPLFKKLLSELLGEPLCEKEKIIFSIPASPMDAPFDVAYHESVITSILASLGFEGRSINEAHAIAFSELSSDDDNYTGACLSFGSGMSNIAVVNTADLVCSFSVARGGDYIDMSSATSLGYEPADNQSEITPSLVTFIKEQGVDIANPDPNDRIKIAISAYYKSLIRYVVANLIKELNKSSSTRFTKPVKFVVSGGTSLAIGFLEMFKQELLARKDELPFQIKDVVHAAEPLNAVAIGALLALLSEI